MMQALDEQEYIASMYLELIPIYANLNLPDSASYYTEKYKELQNKNIENQVAFETAELETKYQAEKNKKLLLEKEAEARQKNAQLLLLGVFTTFVGLVGWLIYRQQKLKIASLNRKASSNSPSLRLKRKTNSSNSGLTFHAICTTTSVRSSLLSYRV
jgi:hypothetical protein